MAFEGVLGVGGVMVVGVCDEGLQAEGSVFSMKSVSGR